MSTTKRGVGRSAMADDSDLEDLLQSNNNSKKKDGKYDDDTTVSNAPLNLDHLTKGQLDVMPRRAGSRSGSPGLAAVASAHCKYLCYMYPRCCGCVSVATGAFLLFFLLGAALNPTETFGLIPNDYSEIKSEYDLTLGKIHHWCLKGDNDSCRCEDPLEPNSRIEFKTWNDAHKANKNKVEAFRDSELLDVAFLGESLVEEMDGTWMGRQQGDELKSIAKIFRSQFKREKSGIEGVALGIAGDTVSAECHSRDSSIDRWITHAHNGPPLTHKFASNYSPPMSCGDCYMVKCLRISTHVCGGSCLE
jgi:hypothetical protein